MFFYCAVIEEFGSYEHKLFLMAYPKTAQSSPIYILLVTLYCYTNGRKIISKERINVYVLSGINQLINK